MTVENNPGKKIAVILGIGSAVGSEIAKSLSQKGYSIIGTLRDPAIPQSKLPLQIQDIRPTLLALDISNRSSIDAFCHSMEGIPHIDFFTNAIATYSLNRFEKMPFEAFESDLSINFTNYAYLLSKISHKFSKGSSLLFILTDMVLDKPAPYLSSYVSSKYALLGLMKSLSLEWAPKGIRVNAISPGIMQTKFTSALPRYVSENYAKSSAAKRFILPSEVARIAMRLVDDEGSNGENARVE